LLYFFNRLVFDPPFKFRFKTQCFAIDAILSILSPPKVEKSGNIEIKWGVKRKKREKINI